MRYCSLLPVVAIAIVAAPGSFAFAQDVSPTSAREFVAQAAIGDMYEVQAGKLAESMGTAAGVKTFGRHMVVAHTETTAKLKAAIGKSGLDITPPSHIDAKHQKMLDQLKTARGPDFDQAYLGQQEVAHQDALKLMQTYANSGDNDALKHAAASIVHVVKDHIAMLAKLKAAQ